MDYLALFVVGSLVGKTEQTDMKFTVKMAFFELGSIVLILLRSHRMVVTIMMDKVTILSFLLKVWMVR
jgi:hypothetical protein